MPNVVCFFLDRLPKIRRRLRRFTMNRDCPVQSPDKVSCCNASAPLDEIGYTNEIIEWFDWTHLDERWPKQCAACGYVFVADDNWQVASDFIYRRTDTGEELVWRDAPAGAMIDCHWMRPHWRGPDGLCLMVKLPNGCEWIVDGPAASQDDKSKAGWTRTGTPPNVTATPSILARDYHGFLRDGVLVDA